MRFPRFFGRLGAVICLAGHLSAQMSAPPSPEAAFDQASELYTAGRYGEAADAFEKVVADYPTSPLVAEAQFRHGLTRFLAGDFARAIAELRKTQTPSTPPRVAELGAGLLPQALAAAAAKLPVADPGRDAAFADAISAYDAFLQKYPQSDETENAIYGRALTAFQIKHYAETERDLRANLERFPRSESIQDSQYLLALVLATEGSVAAHTAGSLTPEAAAKDDEAEKFLGDLIGRSSDVALVNDARFQLGELLLSRAADARKDVQPRLWERAVAAYRSVAPKEPMLRAQTARLAGFPDRIRAAGLAHDAAQLQRLQRERQREETKLAQLRTRADQTITARIKIAQIYFAQGQFDASRVLLHYCEPLAEDDDQKKNILYYTTLTYAAQSLVEPALAGYDRWKSSFAPDPLGENLPLVIGAMFLSTNPRVNDPERAIGFFRESLQSYPQGRFVNEALSQLAGALLQLKRYDEALQIYQQFLAKNPPRELAATAEMGIADIQQQTGRLDEALASFQAIRSRYGDLPQADQAALASGQLLLNKGDAAGAIAALQKFVKARPASELVPAALYTIAQAQQTAGDKAGALETFRQLGENYPTTEAGLFSFIQRGTLLAGENRLDELTATMRDFIARYPESDQLFYGYDLIAQAQTNAGQLAEATATYLAMAADHPQNARTADALIRAAQISRRRAEKLGRYLALNDAQRADWTAALAASLAQAERVVRDYATGDQVASALQEILATQRLFLAAKLKTEANIESYFTDLATQVAAQPAARSKVLFALATFLAAKDKPKALAQMEAAYDPKLIYAPADLDLYGAALIEQDALSKAFAVYQKIAADYPNPLGIPPDKAPAPILEAQSIALFGEASVLQKQGKLTDAAPLFDRLKLLYPWSPKIIEADYGLALGRFEAKKYADATTLLVQVIRAQNASADLRASAMLLLGKIQETQGQLEPAIDQFIKISVFYKGVPAAAAEGLWRGAQLLEKQAAALADPQKKKTQFAKAVKAYHDLADGYGDSPFAAPARQRLAALHQP